MDTRVKSLNRLCLSCNIEPNQIHWVKRQQGGRKSANQFNLRYLLLIYGGIEVEQGALCRSCHNKLIKLHQNCTDFYNACQRNIKFPKRISCTPYKNTPKRRNIGSDDHTESGTSFQSKKNVFGGESPDIIISTPVTDAPVVISSIPVVCELEIQISSIDVESSVDKSETDISDHSYFRESLTCDILIPSIEISEKAAECQQNFRPVKMSKSPPVVSASLSCNTDHEHSYASVKKVSTLNKPAATFESHTSDHTYVESALENVKCNDLLKKISEFTKSINDEKFLTDTERSNLMEKLTNGTVEDIVNEVLKIPAMKNELICSFKNEINSSAILLKQRKDLYISFLMKKEDVTLDYFSWWPLIEELTTKMPLLLHFILSAVISDYDYKICSKLEKMIPRICMVFAIILQTRCDQLNLLQRFISMLLYHSKSSKKVYDRLNILGVCLSHDETLKISSNIAEKDDNATFESHKSDHSYEKSVPKFVKNNDALKRLIEFMKSINDEKFLTDTERSNLMEKLPNGTVEDIVNEVLKIPALKNKLICSFKNEINSLAILLKQKKHFYVSVLMKKEDDTLDDFSWWPLIEEFITKMPILFHFILSAMISDYDCTMSSKLDKIIPRISMLFAIILQTRYDSLSLLQRLITRFLSDSNSSKYLYGRLNLFGVCLGYVTSLKISKNKTEQKDNDIVDSVKSKVYV